MGVCFSVAKIYDSLECIFQWQSKVQGGWVEEDGVDSIIDDICSAVRLRSAVVQNMRYGRWSGL